MQREFIFDDFVEGSKRSWIKPKNRLSVVFVGEPAVGDGGPRRDFFTITECFAMLTVKKYILNLLIF